MFETNDGYIDRLTWLAFSCKFSVLKAEKKEDGAFFYMHHLRIE